MPGKRPSGIVKVLDEDPGYDCTLRRLIVVGSEGLVSEIDE